MEAVLKTVDGDELSEGSNPSPGVNKETIDIGCKLYYWSYRQVRTLNTYLPLSLYILLFER